jgi:dephospho-CoA kinase
MKKKYVIGLTGNIATGKSVVRRMLQELGASTVDADRLVHVLQEPGTQVYKEIVETFGSFILNVDATINRKQLGDIAFNVPEAMTTLEEITHPAVRQYIDRAIEKAPSYVVVVEAIKLIEGGLADKCDAVWVVNASEDNQVVRLMTKRHMNNQDTIRRIQAQPRQAEKLARADVIINNDGSLIATWNEVQKKYNEIPKPEVAEPEPAKPKPVTIADGESVEFRRAKRSDLTEIATLIADASQGELEMDEADMMERLFSKGYMVALQQEKIVGVVGWQTENLVAGVDDFFVKSSTMWLNIGAQLIERVEEEVSQLSCEAGLVFLHHKTGPVAKKCLESKGYKVVVVEDMKERAWREAAVDWSIDNTIMMVKQLLERRINTPI